MPPLTERGSSVADILDRPPAWQERAWLGDLTDRLGLLRDTGGEISLLTIGARGPSDDCPDGNVAVTIDARGVLATAEAIHLQDALYIAIGAVNRALKLKAEEKAKTQQVSA